jgi:hypothetical protein
VGDGGIEIRTETETETGRGGKEKELDGGGEYIRWMIYDDETIKYSKVSTVPDARHQKGVYLQICYLFNENLILYSFSLDYFMIFVV